MKCGALCAVPEGSRRLLTDLTILDIPSGVKDGGVVHNLNIPRNQLLGDVKIRVFSQVCYCSAQSHPVRVERFNNVQYLTLGGLSTVPSQCHNFRWQGWSIYTPSTCAKKGTEAS